MRWTSLFIEMLVILQCSSIPWPVIIYPVILLLIQSIIEKHWRILFCHISMLILLLAMLFIHIYPVIFIQLYIFHGYVVIYPYLSSSVASHSVGHCSSRWSRRCGDREFGWEITGHEIPTQCGWQTQGQVPRQVVWENHIGKPSEILGKP